MVMMKKTFTAVALTALVSTSALAAGTNASIENLPDEGQVTLTGTVENVENEREFTLRDKTGTIDVDIESNQSVVLKPGAQVTVYGSVDSGITGKDINASQVEVHKNLSQTVGDAVDGTKGMPVDGASVYPINRLPQEGLVKVSGTVSEVDSEKEFTLQDDTGSINVEIESSDAAAVTKGAEVTVIGYVDSGMMGKDINATKVLVTADAEPMANR